MCPQKEQSLVHIRVQWISQEILAKNIFFQLSIYNEYD